MIRCRNLFYDSSISRIHKVPVRVVSVGNITVGGTGKTPLVLATGREALRRGLGPAVVARGYRGRIESGALLSDEGLMLRNEVPGLRVLQDPDRVKAATAAISGEGADFIIMDDGFQHRRLHRDLDIVVIDATRPFGFRRVLPAGLLREPLSGLNRAQALVLTRCDQVDPAGLEAIESYLSRAADHVPRFKTAHVPVRLHDLAVGNPCEPSILSGVDLFAFSGIANPGAFENTLTSLGGRIAGRSVFPDHHWYTRGDLENIRRGAGACGAEMVVTTAKDGARLSKLEGCEPFLVLDVEIRFLEGEDSFWNLVFGADSE